MSPKNYMHVLLLFQISYLFQGCSGHFLQDLVDGKTDNNSSSEQHKEDPAQTSLTPPSQNSALNAISPSSTAQDKHSEYRYMQKSTNTWIEKEWEPITESNTSTVQKTKNNSDESNITQTQENNATGLQYYVDKAGIYLENKKKNDANRTKAPSHTEKINAMPGIGKRHKRR